MVPASTNGVQRRLKPVSNEPPAPMVSLIIPTLNEAENLRHVLPTLPSVVDELVIVDGGSTDGTVEVVRELRPDATIVHDPRPGKGIALQSGFDAARDIRMPSSIPCHWLRRGRRGPSLWSSSSSTSRWRTFCCSR